MKAQEALDAAATTDEEGEGEEEVTIGETAGDESRTDEAESDRPRRVEMQLGRHQVANVRPSVDEMGNPIDPGRLQRNVRSESVEETLESEPDTDVMGRNRRSGRKVHTKHRPPRQGHVRERKKTEDGHYCCVYLIKKH
ncbi:hypothetical protein CEXT_384541 [Caerostris extrusa]|uniref:Uncharacterized protein n=1 Tax=Caerostris extrusa TaxID=172846 RepID=A0AAV4RQ10_CAEEX|nr:hypothetical protein CEXT_384541 [Caerostris extrusa]